MQTTHYQIDHGIVTTYTTDAAVAERESRAGARVTATTVKQE